MKHSGALYDRLSTIRVGNTLCEYTQEQCKDKIPLIEEIQALKQEKSALILAHSYVHPDIIYGVADEVGDSFALAKAAQKASCDRIIFPAVRFMAETAKILNPEKIVIDPNPYGGCSLAESISPHEVLELKAAHPDFTFVCYINTTAEVKALCDVCVTSSNVYEVLSRIPNEKIFFLPDRFMGKNLQNALAKAGIHKEIRFSGGSCYVHEQFDIEQIALMKQIDATLVVLAHPECTPEVIGLADQILSTSGMMEYVKKHHASNQRFLLLTECGIMSRLQVECPEANIVGSCMLCKYMRSNSLEQIRQALLDPRPSQIIELNDEIQTKALRCLEAMFYYTK
ncbi:MAG: quinolinate synthase NadA [Chlamydiales bacterium]